MKCLTTVFTSLLFSAVALGGSKEAEVVKDPFTLPAIAPDHVMLLFYGYGIRHGEMAVVNPGGRVDPLETKATGPYLDLWVKLDGVDQGWLGPQRVLPIETTRGEHQLALVNTDGRETTLTLRVDAAVLPLLATEANPLDADKTPPYWPVLLPMDPLLAEYALTKDGIKELDFARINTGSWGLEKGGPKVKESRRDERWPELPQVSQAVVTVEYEVDDLVGWDRAGGIRTFTLAVDDMGLTLSHTVDKTAKPGMLDKMTASRWKDRPMELRLEADRLVSVSQDPIRPEQLNLFVKDAKGEVKGLTLTSWNARAGKADGERGSWGGRLRSRVGTADTDEGRSLSWEGAGEWGGLLTKVHALQARLSLPLGWGKPKSGLKGPTLERVENHFQPSWPR